MSGFDEKLKNYTTNASSCYVGNYFDYRLLLIGNESSFVDVCYGEILKRLPDENGRLYFNDLLLRKGRLAVITELYFSKERIEINANLSCSKALVFFRVIGLFEKALLKLGISTSCFSKKYGSYLERKAVFFKFFNEQSTRISKIVSDRLLENENKMNKFDLTLKSQEEKIELHREKLARINNFQLDYLNKSFLLKCVETKDNESVDSNYFLNEINEYYKAFEDAYRGSNEEIRNKQSFYIPFIGELKNRTMCRDAVDIGCGRGEWLKLLEEQNLNAVGVDMNGSMVKFCQDQSLVAIETDALSYLKKLEDSSVALVSGFHIVEHIPFDIFFEIIKQTSRVMTEGGLAIFETPNPENILVGSHYFYHDFSHKNPVTPLSLSFLFKYHGFKDVRIERVNPFPESEMIHEESEVSKRWNSHFYGAQDYAIVAIK